MVTHTFNPRSQKTGWQTTVMSKVSLGESERKGQRGVRKKPKGQDQFKLDVIAYTLNFKDS